MQYNFQTLTKYLLISAGLSLTLWSCSDNKFKIKGEIYGAEEKTILLEKSDFQGKWLAVDSARINKNGGFSIDFPAAPAPDIYRLSLNNQYIYLPVDSTETITVTSSWDNFGRGFSLDGSKNARQMEKFEKELQNANTTNPDSIIEFKRRVYSNYMKDAGGSILSFYILTKMIDGKPLYDPFLPEDRKYFGAAATGYQTTNPNDPHAKILENITLQSIKKKNNENGNYKTIEAEEINVIDIDLPDESGKNVKLSDVVGNGKPVVVIFSLLNMEDSPELNIALAQLYNKLNGKVEFYNVSLDADQYAWREAARNLPWITVYSPGQNSSVDARNYNVFQVPSFFIYNSDGELTSRPMTLDELVKSL